MSTERVNELTDQINQKIAEYRSKYENGTRAELSELNTQTLELQRARAALICEGCSPCPSCKEPPVGLIQIMVVDRAGVDGFSVGCSYCLDHQAVGQTVEAARSNWEAGPRVEAKVDANGAVLARASGGWRKPRDGRQLVKRVDGAIITVMPDGRKVSWASNMALETRRKLAQTLSKNAGLTVGESGDS